MTRSDWIPQIQNRRGKRRHKNRYVLSNDGGVTIDAAVNENLARYSSAEQALGDYVLGAAFRGKWERQVPRVVHHKWRIADFICSEAALVVEVDDDLHWRPERIIDDFERDLAFADEGFRVLRFSDDELLCNTQDVVAVIAEACSQRLRRQRRTVPEKNLNTDQLIERASDLSAEEIESLYDFAREMLGPRSRSDGRVRAFMDGLRALKETRLALPFKD